MPGPRHYDFAGVLNSPHQRGVLLGLLRRELLRNWREPGEAVHGALLFILIATIFPFATEPTSAALGEFAVGIVWVAAMVAATLSLDGLFRADFHDGSLELMATSGASLALVGIGKAGAHYLTAWLPIALLAGLASLMFGVSVGMIGVVVASLLVAGLSISLIGTPISALTVGLRGSGMLLALLILPLYIPLLIFGASAAVSFGQHRGAAAEFYFLAGYLALALTVAPWATAAAIRIRLS